MSKPTYRLTIVPEGGCTVPDVIELRRLLKCLLRGYHFRAVLVEQLPGSDDQADAAPSAGRPQSG
jgi:hypothetical protein